MKTVAMKTVMKPKRGVGRRAMKENKAKTWTKMTVEELNVAKKLYAEDMQPSEIARLLGRESASACQLRSKARQFA